MKMWILSAMLPLIAQVLTPFLTEFAKRAALMLVSKLPRGAVAIVAAAIGELVNQLQALLTGFPLPAQFSTVAGIVLNEFVNDLTKGLKESPA